MTLKIKESVKDDALNKYYLEVENSEGSQKYFYTLVVNDKDAETSTEGGGGTTGAQIKTLLNHHY